MKSQNPYQQVYRRRQQRNTHARYQSLGYLSAVLLLTGLLREQLAVYVSGVEGLQRLEQVLFRTAGLLVALTTLQTYVDVVRHPERDIFGIHPVRAKAFVRHVGWQRLKTSSWFLGMAIGIWTGVPRAWLPWLTGYLVSAWLAGIGAGYGVHLASIWAARSPAMAGVLDAIRGANPREQAAFIYAPGIALGIVGIVLVFGAGATRLVIEGQLAWAWWLLGPAIVGGCGWLLSLRLAPSQLLRGSMLLSDVDAHWSLVDGEENPREVYLEWLVGDDPQTLRLLRQSWRLHRWVTLVLWVVGAMMAIAVMVGEFWSVQVGLTLTAAASLGIPMLLQHHEPMWLQRSLGISQVAQAKALWVVSNLLLMGVWLPVILSLLWVGEQTMLVELGMRMIGQLGLLYWMSVQVQTSAVGKQVLLLLGALLMWGSVVA